MDPEQPGFKRERISRATGLVCFSLYLFFLLFLAKIKKAELSDCRLPVRDVKFAPKHLGLKLATCCDDGVVRFQKELLSCCLPPFFTRVCFSRLTPCFLFSLVSAGDTTQVRIYEAADKMNLSSWSQAEDFKVRPKGKCTCISWNPSR